MKNQGAGDHVKEWLAIPEKEFEEIEFQRIQIDQLLQQRDLTTAITLLEKLENKYHTLSLGNTFPSFYNMKGVALFESNQIAAAVTAFTAAITDNPLDIRAGINLGSLLPQFTDDLQQVYSTLERLTGSRNIDFALLQFDWKEIEVAIHRQEEKMTHCVETKDEGYCDLLSIGISGMLLPPSLLKKYFLTINNFNEMLYPSSKSSSSSLSAVGNAPNDIADRTISFKQDQNKATMIGKSRMIRIGFLLTRIDSGPVIDLTHLLFKYLKSSHSSSPRVEVIGFFLSHHKIEENYQTKIFDYFHQVFSFADYNITQSVTVIRSQQIDILIEMNGWNTNTGFLIMKQRPAKILISYLGDPMTTGTYFIDYQLTDAIVTPPDAISSAFTEKLIFLPTSYLVNSHLEWQRRNILLRPSYYDQNHQIHHSRMSKRELLKTLSSLSSKNIGSSVSTLSISSADFFLLGCFHNWNKITPTIFHVWMNLLHAIPNAHILLMKGKNITNVDSQASYYGVPSNRRFHFLPYTEGSERHYYYKSSIDLYLDTILKNGHVTSLDAQFIGIPSIAVSGLSSRMSARSSESIQYYSTAKVATASACGSGRLHQHNYGIVFSLKEYEDLVIHLLKTKKGRSSLSNWRNKNVINRRYNRLFHLQYFVQEFIYLMQSLVEIDEISSNTTSSASSLFEENEKRKFHVFSSSQ